MTPIATVWNADQEIMQTLMFYMTKITTSFTNWDIEGIYSDLNIIDMVSFAKFQEDNTYKTMMEEDWSKMEKLRRQMHNAKDDRDYEKKMVEFYNVSRNIFKQFGALCKHHGIYFREGRDPSKSALRV